MSACHGKGHAQDEVDYVGVLKTNKVDDVDVQGAYEVDAGERFHSAPTFRQECLSG